MKKRLLLLFWSVLAAAAATALEVTVGPEGISPHEALSRIRAARAAGERGTCSVRIDGRIALKETLVLAPEDSGVRFVAAGDGAALVGGEELTGWRDAGDGTWTCPAPRRADGGLIRFEQLWTNGKRAGRSVYPKKGFALFARAEQEKLPKGGPFKYRNTFVFDRPPPVSGKTDWLAAKIVVVIKWACSRQVVSSYDAATGEFTLDTDDYQVPWKMWGAQDEKPIAWLENVDFGFTDPGDWFYDERAGLIRYRPRPGETLENFTALAPTAGLRELVRLQGDPDARSYVRDVVFSGIGFEATAVQNDDSDAPDGRARTNARQAAVFAPGAVMLEAARNIRFEDCRVRHTGGYAFRIADGSMSNVIVRCTMDDLGAGGVFAGAGKRNPDHYMADERLWKRDGNLPCPKVYDYSERAVAFIEVSDCEISRGGQVNKEGIGVLFTNISDSKIVHNDIHDIYYSGVSVGWSWGYRGSVSQRNEVSFNRISNLGAGVMSDLAGVYTLGTSHGTVVSNNVICNVKARYYGGWGLYTDEGSEGIVMENNLVYDTFDGGFHQHYGRNNVVRNNIFAYSERDQIAVTAAENHLSVAFLNNIILWDRRTKGEEQAFVKYDGLVTGKSKTIFVGNLWWNEGSATLIRKWTPFSAWQRDGNDVVGACADPKFVDAAKRDFRLRKDSPALALGFKPWDFSKSGRK